MDLIWCLGSHFSYAIELLCAILDIHIEKCHRTGWKIFDRLKFTFCTETIEFYFTLKNRIYILANPYLWREFKRIKQKNKLEPGRVLTNI